MLSTRAPIGMWPILGVRQLVSTRLSRRSTHDDRRSARYFRYQLSSAQAIDSGSLRTQAVNVRRC